MYLSRAIAGKRSLTLRHLPAAAAAAFSTESGAAGDKRGFRRRTNRPEPSAAEPEISLKAEPARETPRIPDATAASASSWMPRSPPAAELQRPSMIPFQTKVANAVQLVGSVGVPVQLQKLADGRYTAVSVLVHDKRSGLPQLWIPVIFKDELAQIAACHLKENDLIHVAGQLSGDVPPFKISDGQANIQVVAQTLSYVDNGYPEKDDYMVDEKKEVTSKFRGKVWNNNLTKLWDHLVVNPQKWIDYRADKLNGSKNPKHPDFKNKVTQEPLWLNTAPEWVLENLKKLVFYDSHSVVEKEKASIEKNTQKGKFMGGGGVEGKAASAASNKKPDVDLWKNLVDNPKQWWDNRSDKLKPTYPDFKHKDTGEGLWIKPTTPEWVLSKLPPIKSKEASKKTARPRDTLLS